jgi:ABC-type oligopeptide transport system substrate-binding subunit
MRSGPPPAVSRGLDRNGRKCPVFGMMKRRLVLAATLLALHATVCAIGVPAHAKALVMGLVTPPTGLDPHVSIGAADASVMMNIYEALTRRDHAVSGTPR